MRTAYNQTSPLQAPYLPMMATQPGLEQPPWPQPPPGAATMMLQPPDQTQLGYNFSVIQAPPNLPGVQPVQMEPIQLIQNFNNLQPMAPAQNINPYMAPVMAVVLPNYPTFTPGYPSMFPPAAPTLLPQAPINLTGFTATNVPYTQPMFQAQPPPTNQTPLGAMVCSPRASSSVGEDEEAAGPPALFSSSRSSSPLQLNLLQEELPKPNEGQGSTGHNHAESLHEQHVNEVSAF